jgi:hypothetical protein
VGRTVGFAVGLWFVLALTVAVSGVTAGNPLAMPLTIAIPLLSFGVLWFSAPAFRNWALHLDQGLLVLLHTGRMLGLGFVMLWYFEVLPWQFALPAGLGDSAAAFWALLVGVAIYRGTASRANILAWNTFGMIDFVVALAMGLLSRSAPFGLIAGGVSADPMQLFPLNIVPLFGVPLFTITHLIIYAQLRRRTA